MTSSFNEYLGIWVNFHLYAVKVQMLEYVKTISIEKKQFTLLHTNDFQMETVFDNSATT